MMIDANLEPVAREAGGHCLAHAQRRFREVRDLSHDGISQLFFFHCLCVDTFFLVRMQHRQWTLALRIKTYIYS